MNETEQTHDSKTETKTPQSLRIIAMAMCTALYAIGSYTTAYIPSPWGFGQFRPAVIVPAFFASVFGPLPGAIGAAFGTLIADSLKHGYLYPGSLIAAVPGNFIGFYLFGYIVRKKFSWGRFVLASNVTLTIANLIVAFLYVFAFKVLYLNAPEFSLPTETLTFISFGLTIYWYVTMLPFVLLLVPPLILITAWAFPSIVPEAARMRSLGRELPKTTFSLAMMIPGIVMLLIGLISTSFAEFGKLFSLKGTALIVTQTLFYASGVVLIALGIMIFAGGKLFWRYTPLKKTEKSVEGKMIEE